MGINRHRLERAIEGRWFALAEFTAAAVAASLVYFVPTLGGWPLLLPIGPWVARASIGKFPFRRTIFDIPLGIFLITALVGIWAAYNREFAWTKFWILASAVLLFYSLAGQPARNLWSICAFFAGLGVFAAAFFLLGHDWVAEPLKIGVLNRLGESWMAIRPKLSLETLHPNSTGTFITMFSPFAVVIALRSWRERRGMLTVLSLGALALMAVALVMTTSRGAWMGLTAAAGLWVLWLISKLVSARLRLSPALLFTTLAATIFALGALTVAAVPTGLQILADSLPGPSVASSRLELVRAGLALAKDFPFTGGGLGAFPGLFSQYWRVVPFFLLGHSHNLFLDVAVEQGIGGAFALLVVMLGGIVKMFLAVPKIYHKYSLLLGAALIGLVAALAHGLIDDPIYGLAATPMLLLIPGLGVALAREPQRVVEPSRVFKLRKSSRVWVAGILLIVVAGAVPMISNVRDPVRASWYANLGAVTMARVELAYWPTNRWDDGSNIENLIEAQVYFERALELDPTNRTALHRLGLIAMLSKDFESAVSYLGAAFEVGPTHDGIRKSLGYSYGWSGQAETGTKLLSGIPNIRQELEVYEWWWGEQGREDLAASAAEMADMSTPR